MDIYVKIIFFSLLDPLPLPSHCVLFPVQNGYWCNGQEHFCSSAHVTQGVSSLVGMMSLIS